MGNVARIAPEHKRVEAPESLRSLAGWLCWRSEQHEGEPKPRKVPYWASGGRRHGKHGAPEDRSKLVTFPAAVAAAQRLGMDGVGFALLPEWGVVALDFDRCVGPDGDLPPDVLAIVSDTYCEYSPSGEGVRAFVMGDLGNHKSAASATRYGFETFSTNGFVTLTGNVLPFVELLGLENTIAPTSGTLSELCARRFGESSAAADPDDFMAGHEPQLGLGVEAMQELLDQLDPDMPRDDWIRVGMAAHHECEGDDTGFWLWHDWSEQGGKYPGEEALKEQWNSFERRKGPGRRQVTMASVIHMTRNPALALAATSERVATRAEERVLDLPPSTGPCTPVGFIGKFPVHAAGEMSRQQSGDWLIKNVLPRGDLIVLYGAPSAGKSFVAFDMLAAVARGMPWRGKRVTKGRVLFVVAEGSGGYGKRIRAYCQQHNISADDLDIGIITVSPNILQVDDITELGAAILAVGDVDAVVFDTYAQVTPGANENSGEDMGRALGNLRVLREVTGATMILVHHEGKDASRGARGWSGLKAAVDAEIAVVRHDDSNAREIRLTKMKDGDDSLRWGFHLHTLTVGMDADGDEETSCVVIEAEMPVAEGADTSKRIKRRGFFQNHVLEVIATLDSALTSIKLQDLVDKAKEMLPPPEGDDRDLRRQNVARAIQALAREKEGPLGVSGNLVIFYQ